MDIRFQRGLISDIGNCSPYDNTYIQLNYNLRTHEAWGDWFYSIGRNDWKRYDDEDIIIVGNYAGRTTRTRLAEDIIGRVMAYEALTAL